MPTPADPALVPALALLPGATLLCYPSMNPIGMPESGDRGRTTLFRISRSLIALVADGSCRRHVLIGLHRAPTSSRKHVDALRRSGVAVVDLFRSPTTWIIGEIREAARRQAYTVVLRPCTCRSTPR